jgi:hypothetical protein
VKGDWRRLLFKTLSLAAGNQFGKKRVTLITPGKNPIL